MSKFDFKSALSEWSSSENRECEVAQEKAIYRVANELYMAMKEANMTNSQLAERVDKKPGFITRVFKGDHNMTVKTLASLAFAMDKEVFFDLRDKRSDDYQWEKISTKAKTNIVNFPNHLKSAHKVAVDEFQFG